MSTDNDKELIHTRQITCRAFRLKNGWLEIEAKVTDLKGQDLPFRSRPPVPAGEYVHRMSLSLVMDQEDVIRDVKADTEKAPWAICTEGDANYRKLIGLQIGGGFSRKVKERLGGVNGCTHLTELVTQAANTYMQAAWPDRLTRMIAIEPDPSRWPAKNKPAFLDRCHAQRKDGQPMLSEYPELVSPKE